MRIINVAMINYEYKHSEVSPIITETIFSNRVITNIIFPNLNIKKYVDKISASKFEILTYKIIILNVGNECVKNVMFYDFIPESTRVIRNSIKINRQTLKGLKTLKGIYIGKIPSKKSVSIYFKVIVLPNCNITNIRNFAIIGYDFTNNIEKAPMRIILKTNDVCTHIYNNLFTQIEVKSVIKLSDDIIDNFKVNKIFVKIELLKNKVISSIKGYKILVIGKITYEIIYKNSLKQFKDKKNFSEGFSCLISVPTGIKYLKDYKIKLFLEETNFAFTNNNILVLDSEILVKI